MIRTILLILTATGAAAKSEFSAEDFDTFTRGKTFYFSADGSFFGAEQYLGNRRVRWMFPDGACADGHWYVESGEFCFVYDDVPGAQCWIVRRAGDQILAELSPGSEGNTIMSELVDTSPLDCPGPDLGV